MNPHPIIIKPLPLRLPHFPPFIWKLAKRLNMLFYHPVRKRKISLEYIPLAQNIPDNNRKCPDVAGERTRLVTQKVNFGGDQQGGGGCSNDSEGWWMGQTTRRNQ